MKLYKYVPLDRAREIITAGRIAFSLVDHFNDPFDQPIAPEETGTDLWGKTIAPIRAGLKNRALALTSGILSLTRTPVNALMWAHYANSHRGVVLGLDMEDAGLLDPNSNMIPAHLGSVVYSRHRNINGYSSVSANGFRIGGTHHFDITNYEKLQRLFLHKPIDWAYEEEVRVVKCLGGLVSGTNESQSGKFDVVDTSEGPRYLYHLPPGSIREIYAGARCDVDEVRDLRAMGTNINLRYCTPDQKSYRIISKHGGFI